MKKIVIVFLILTISLSVFVFIFYQNYFSKEKYNPAMNLKTITEEANPEAVETIATNLEIPWSLAFLPDGSILVTERTGNLKRVMGRKVIEIEKIPDVKAIGEGGLMGVVLHPEFQNNNFVYLMYTYSSDGDNTLNRVVRYEFKDDKLSNRKIIVDEIPGARFHNGGRIKFGPDNYLYITTGDAQNTSLAQNTNSLAGKILRVTDEGSSAPGNPFNSEVYSYGHRNPQGITWDRDGNLWQTEHGRSNPTGFDEINLIEPGLNYGWPEIEGDETRDGMVTPIADSGLGTWAPGSAAILENSLFFGGLRPETLFEYKIDDELLVEHFTNEFGRIRDVVVGPDNMLYITTSNRDGRGEAIDTDDRIFRIDPAQL